jgi:hypothetical protein
MVAIRRQHRAAGSPASRVGKVLTLQEIANKATAPEYTADIARKLRNSSAHDISREQRPLDVISDIPVSDYQAAVLRKAKLSFSRVHWEQIYYYGGMPNTEEDNLREKIIALVRDTPVEQLPALQGVIVNFRQTGSITSRGHGPWTEPRLDTPPPAAAGTTTPVTNGSFEPQTEQEKRPPKEKRRPTQSDATQETTEAGESIETAAAEMTKPERPHWKDVCRPGEGLGDFIKREFELELTAGTMMRPLLNRYRGLYQAFDNTLRRHPEELPQELREIPKKPEVNDRLVAEGKVAFRSDAPPPRSVELRTYERDRKRVAAAARRHVTAG